MHNLQSPANLRDWAAARPSGGCNLDLVGREAPLLDPPDLHYPNRLRPCRQSELQQNRIPSACFDTAEYVLDLTAVGRTKITGGRLEYPRTPTRNLGLEGDCKSSLFAD